MRNRRWNTRRHAMGVILAYINENPGATALSISRGTSISRIEVSRYINPRMYEFRSTPYILSLRERNRAYYDHLISDAIYTRVNGVEGFMVNLSKRKMFDMYCFSMGYVLSVNHSGQSFVETFLCDSEARFDAIGRCVLSKKHK